jgi:ribosomal protein S18 acetylase RimI-like enzyme
MTTRPIDIRRNVAGQLALAEHLHRCQADFRPALATRTTIDAYAEKLATRAERFEAWRNDELIGVVAMYCNDPRGREAFVTSVSVDAAARGKGVASALLERAVGHARTHGMDRVALEVDVSNAAARALYARAGFDEVERNGRVLRLVMPIPPRRRTDT